MNPPPKWTVYVGLTSFAAAIGGLTFAIVEAYQAHYLSSSLMVLLSLALLRFSTDYLGPWVQA